MKDGMQSSGRGHLKPNSMTSGTTRLNGEVKEFSNEDEPWNITGAEFVDRKTITLSEGLYPAHTRF